MSSRPLVTVIIPVHNAEKYLAETLGSVQMQTLRDIEVIPVDDGSTDGSPAILEAFACEDGRFHPIWQENAGAAAARNNGIEHAKGDYLVFLDADDLFEPTMLEEMRDACERTGADVCECDSDRFTGELADGKVEPNDWMPVRLQEGLYQTKDIEDVIFQCSYDHPWDKMVRRSLVEEKGLRFQDLPCYNDMYFSHMAICEARSVFFLRRALAHYRVGLGSSLQGGRYRHPLTSLRVADRLRDDLAPRLEEIAALRDSLHEFGFYCFLPCLSNLALGKRQGREATQEEFDALSAYWNSWKLGTLKPRRLHSRRDSAKLAMLKAFGIESYVNALVENGSQSRYEGVGARSYARFFFACVRGAGQSGR